MADTFVKIATQTVGAGGAASVTISSIPSTYTDLVIKYSARGSYAATYDVLGVYLNGSTTNYTMRYLEGTGSAANSYTNTIPQAFVTGSTATASTFANGEIYIPNYAGSTNKSFSIDDVQENNATAALSHLSAVLWSNTAAVSSITFTDLYGTLQQYSTFTLYGISKS